MIKRLIPLAGLTVCLFACTRQTESNRTYCNPIDIDYSYMVYNSDQNLSYRSGADPAIVRFKGEYYMFVTRSHGYWHSTDLRNWDFITPQSIWYPQGSNAPAAHNYKDSVLFVTGDPSGEMSILKSTDPKSGKWVAEHSILHDLQDPDLFIDDDGQAYMFWGSSNFYPLRGKKVDMKDRFLVEGETVAIISADTPNHGWERFGENHSDTRIAAYLEGLWLTKHNGRYYMQYAAPGTEFNVYGDGVYVSDESPLGPYTYQEHNPVCYKPGGWMNGAGHGSTVEGLTDDVFWHFGSMSLSATVNWERRICMFPTFFDEDGIMHCDNAYGDYPHYAPNESGRKGEFTGWMLLSYGKPVSVSSFREGSAAKAEGFDEWNRPETSADFKASNLTDENCKSYWLAATNSDAEWVVIDLEDECTVNAVQVNYYDHQTGIYGRVPGLFHRFFIEGSMDGENWTILEDRSKTTIDAPNAYIELKKAAKARYIRYRNVKIATPNLAIADIRVFGTGTADAPATPSGFIAKRNSDTRNADLCWNEVDGAQGYNVRWGIAPDKLYSSYLVYGKTELQIRSLAKDTRYWFTVESFGTGGISMATSPQEAI